MTTAELKELYKESNDLSRLSQRKTIIEGIVIDFIKQVQEEYPGQTKEAISIIIKNQLRYGMSRPGSFYTYFAMRIASLRDRVEWIKYDEAKIYSLRNLYPNEFGFEALDKIVDIYLSEEYRKENLLYFSPAGLSRRSLNEGAEDTKKAVINTYNQYSQYIWIGAIAIILYLITRK